MTVGAYIYSLSTRYGLGLVKVIPMPGHPERGAASGALLCIAALLREDEEPALVAGPAAVGLFEIGAAAMTKTTPQRERSTLSLRNELAAEVEQDEAYPHPTEPVAEGAMAV